MKKVLFIHIPKTSGSSLTRLFKDTVPGFFVQANATGQLEDADPLMGRVRDLEDIRGVLARHGGLSIHVDSTFEATRKTTDFRSLAWHVFEAANTDYFAQFTLATMLRDPFESFQSAFHFVKRTKAQDPGFLPDLDVGSMESYLGNVHENAILHFLLEPQLARRRTMSRDDLERVKRAVSGYPIHVGIYERHAESIAYFGRLLGRRFDASDVPALNVGEYPSQRDDRLASAFRERNALDYELYEFAVQLFDERLRSAASL